MAYRRPTTIALFRNIWKFSDIIHITQLKGTPIDINNIWYELNILVKMDLMQLNKSSAKCTNHAFRRSQPKRHEAYRINLYGT